MHLLTLKDARQRPNLKKQQTGKRAVAMSLSGFKHIMNLNVILYFQ